jgi:hypothetical protein
MQEKLIPIAQLHVNTGQNGLPKNPRFIRDEKFVKLCQSIKDDPEFMLARPIVCDDAWVILGGNMRYRACLSNGMTELPARWVCRVSDWSLQKKRAFIIKDNLSFGETDYDTLSAEFDVAELTNWGLSLEELTGGNAEELAGDENDGTGESNSCPHWRNGECTK